MFAFSEAVAQGENVKQTVTNLEELAKKAQQEEAARKKKIWEYAIAHQNDPKEDSPEVIEKKKQHTKALEELTALETNDATAAFAALQAAQEIEQKAEAQRGSGEDAETLRK